MTEKELKTKEEILKWMDRNIKYEEYIDNHYRETSKKLRLKSMNCKDR